MIVVEDFTWYDYNCPGVFAKLYNNTANDCEITQI
jgi:hypothetical protein